jgi:hypothetical protein
LIVRPIPPFRLDLTVWALRRRARNEIDRWDGVTYRRVIVIGGRPTELAVRQQGPSTRPRLLVTAPPSLRTPSERRLVRSFIDRLLGLRVDLCDWYRMAERHARLQRLADQFRGMAQYAFPAAPDVARIPPAKYHAIGFSRQKVDAPRELVIAERGARGGRRRQPTCVLPVWHNPPGCSRQLERRWYSSAASRFMGALKTGELRALSAAPRFDSNLNRRRFRSRPFGEQCTCPRTPASILVLTFGRRSSTRANQPDKVRRRRSDSHYGETPRGAALLPRNGFMRRRPTLRRTACSVATSATSMAACSETSRRSITTLGRPLITTFTLHR